MCENFKCFYNMRDEIETHICKESKIKEQERYEELQELIAAKMDIPSESRIKIEHTFINFIPMINKIKIDLLMGRESNSLAYTDYLDLIDKEPQEFDHITDIFLTDLFDTHADDLEFFKQEGVQKLIDRQFTTT